MDFFFFLDFKVQWGNESILGIHGCNFGYFANISSFSLVFLLGFVTFVKEGSLRILDWIFVLLFLFSVLCV